MILNSRRAFLKTSFLTTAVIVMSAGKLFGAVYPLDTMVIAAEDLFAHAKKLEVDVRAYLLIILHHTRVTEEEKTSIRNGAQWLNEEAVAQYKKTYTQLSADKRQEILKIVSKEKWGENWIYALLSYVMEATFSDKVYGVNKNENGQKWLEFAAGMPRPKEPLL
ncbi:MAG: hypothetical protein AUK54_02910 [Helicobacteraceae bacterium CG2_30_36_10]|nr:MAG: hypothetical protein AUK54_02910 [Helicobacteraceae bacterium CG2_30_36_10]